MARTQSITRHLPLCAVLLAALASPGLQAAPKALPKVLAGPTATLMVASDQGNASITVDGAGSYSDALLFTNSDGTTVDLSWRSSLFFDSQQMMVENMKKSTAQKGVSTFTYGPLQVKLVQRLSAAPVSGGYLLEQSYQLSNPGTEPESVNLVRYNDSDMIDPITNQSLGDWGYQPPSGRYNYLVSNAAPTGASLTSYVGTQVTGGGDAWAHAVRACCGDYADITPEENGTVPDDPDMDGISNSGTDRTLVAQKQITVPAGGTVKVKVQTLFGRGALNGLSDLPAR